MLKISLPTYVFIAYNEGNTHKRMTLSETAQLTKKIMVYVIIGLVILFALWGGIAYYLSTRVVEVYVPPPTRGFGILPKPPLPKTKLTSASVSFNLDTETGGLPEKLPDRLNVYAIPKVGVTFSSPQRARRLAEGFSFKNGPKIISPTIYKFNDDKGGELIYQLDTGNFRFKRPVATKSADYIDQENPSMEAETLLSSNFMKYLSEHIAMPNSLASGRTEVFYNNTRPAEASEAGITVWQQDISVGEKELKVDYPIVTPDFKEGLVKGTVTRYQTPENKYLSIDYIYWEVDVKQAQTYPIKTVEEAYKQLQAGEGITVLPYSKSTVAIEKVYLAYILPKEYTPYLQPVYVFEGPGFAAYVAAITPDNFEP